MRGWWSRWATAAYVAAWLGAAAAVAVLAVIVDGHGDRQTISLPAVEATRLVDAARRGGCELRHGADLNPPASGSHGAPPARPGVCEDAPPARALVSALRRGVVVVHYRPGLTGDRVDGLEELQAAAPNGTIVAPNATGMRYEVAATASGHLLGCKTMTESAVEALLLFRGRYLGTGPDVGRGAAGCQPAAPSGTRTARRSPSRKQAISTESPGRRSRSR
jgi:Protein of unknown function (DUF3105)